MKRLIIAAVGLALVGGIIIGGIVGNPWAPVAQARQPTARHTSTPTSTPTPVTPTATPVTRQAEITLVAEPSSVLWGIQGMEYTPTYALTTIDTTKFPVDTSFRFSIGGKSGTGVFCFELAQWLGENTFIPVSGSELCTPGGRYNFTAQSGSLALPSGEQGYAVLWRNVDSNEGTYLGTARVVAEWREP